MKLIYLTSKTYPASTADHAYVRQLAEGFFAILGNRFVLVVANNFGDDFGALPILNLRLHLSRFRTVYYFFWLPRYIFRNTYRTSDTTFLSNDPNLLVLLIVWKKILRAQYKICSDWHLLFGDWRDRFIMRNSDALVTTSEKLKNAIATRSHIDPKKILVAYGGIDLGLYKPTTTAEARRLTQLPQDKKIVAYVGYFKTMGMEKGIRTMVTALSLLPGEVVMLFVGGTDDEMSEYRAYAAARGVAERCIFIGRKSQSELATYEAAADILAIPYPDQPHFRDFGFPMKVYEYMASNRPIIYSKLDLVEEVIGDCAYPFTPDNAASLAKTAEKIMGEGGKASNNASKAYEKVKKYTWVNKADTILKNVTNQATS